MKPRAGAAKPGGSGTLVRRRPMRRGQLIQPFGVGSMADFRNDEALMCAGLDVWFPDGNPPAELRVREERLQRSLGCDYFVMPPDFSENPGGPKRRVPFVRFPRWHYCPRCFRMSEAEIFGDQPFCMDCGTTAKRGRRMIPIRIVAACDAGHIEDFPFRAWVGCTNENPGACQLHFKSGRSSASIQGTKIECTTCGRKQSLGHAFNDAALAAKGAGCSGSQPWLGVDEGRSACTRPLRTVQRGGSNVYFPLVSSSIYIPPEEVSAEPAIRAILDDPARWDLLSGSLVDGRLNPTTVQTFAGIFHVDPVALAQAAERKLRSAADGGTAASTDEEFRRQEFDVLRRGRADHRSDLYCDALPGSAFGKLASFVRTVGLVRKLRETRVLTGFTRLVPPGGTGGVQPLSRNTNRRWLPALVVYGEGIFIEFDNETLSAWAGRPAVTSRLGALLAGYGAARSARGQLPRPVDPRFLLIHTLAHALIRELTFLCGYGSSSLRERIYCNLEPGSEPMAGLLIYTSSGDAEGTLGGLVSQAEPGRLERLFAGAIRRAGWCSNDPVCIESPAQGVDSSSLAACHSCGLLPETSCEEGNRLLDRALLVGTPDDSDVGFFA